LVGTAFVGMGVTHADTMQGVGIGVTHPVTMQGVGFAVPP
jgi:hypothetical protein